MAILINGETNDILIDGESVATDTEVTAQIGAIPTPKVTPQVRQTVLSGAVDTNGFSAFGGSTGSTTVTSSSTLVATCADGANDREGTIVNPSWTGLLTNGTMYLYLDIATDGTCITGKTTLAPTYRWGGVDVVTNLQNTFNIQEMKMEVGNGSTATQVYRVFVGEVRVVGEVVTAITWYALMGRYEGIFVNTLPSVSTPISLNHNIGILPKQCRAEFMCIKTDVGFAVGDVIDGVPTEANSSASVPSPRVLWKNKNNVGFTNSTGNAWEIAHKTTSALTNITLSSWAYRITAQRGW